jgi:hypothetical protein
MNSHRLITRTAIALLVVGPLTCFVLVSAQTIADLPPLPRSKLPSPRTFADQQLQALDKNGDKRVTWEEFSAQLRTAFADMDAQHRGYLTRDDLMRAYEKALAANGQPVPKE